VDPTAAMGVVKVRNISYLFRKSNHDSSIVYPLLFELFFFSCTTVTIQNMYSEHYVLQILLPTFRISVFRDISLWKPQILQLLRF
jgi:transposase